MYIVWGGNRLEGEITIHGAKNAALPILAASVLCRGCRLTNCPRLTDVDAAVDILSRLGTIHRWKGGELTLSPVGKAHDPEPVPDCLMTAMRSSIVFLGGMLARFGSAQAVTPGGCRIGQRPIDLHLLSLGSMGADIQCRDGRISCSCPDGLHGADIELPFPSVGATENILIAASTAKGTTTLRGGAREPEISDLAAFLNSAGADISLSPEGIYRVNGVPELGYGEHRITPDRIEAGTYLAAAAATGGRLLLRDACPPQLMSPLAYLASAGCMVRISRDSVELAAPKRLSGFGAVATMPYPGFPTDLQPVFMAAASNAEGESRFTENIFENRMHHASQLVKAGADIQVKGRCAVVRGVEGLRGAELACADLRDGAALTVAALCAEGESRISDTHYIGRGYQSFCETLRAIGADIREE